MKATFLPDQSSLGGTAENPGETSDLTGKAKAGARVHFNSL